MTLSWGLQIDIQIVRITTTIYLKGTTFHVPKEYYDEFKGVHEPAHLLPRPLSLNPPLYSIIKSEGFERESLE